MTITLDVVTSAGLAILVVERGWSILKELRNGNNGHDRTGEPVCPHHYAVVGDISEVKTDVKWIRESLESNHRVVGADVRD
jgi:hypothetical protein